MKLSQKRHAQNKCSAADSLGFFCDFNQDSPSIPSMNLSSHRRTAPCGKHARSNVHAHQLLEEQFRSIWDVDLSNPSLILARPTLVLLRLEFPVQSRLAIACSTRLLNSENLRNWCHQPAALANVHAIGIRHFEQPLLQESCRTVGNHTITFHFTET